MIRVFLAAILCAALPNLTKACECGQFGSQCIIHQKAVRVSRGYQQQFHQHQLLIPSSQFLIQNHYPAAVYPQGQTVYGSVGQASQLYTLNPELALQAASRMADNAGQALNAAITLGTEANSKVADVTRLQLTVEHLKAAAALTEGKQESAAEHMPEGKPPPEPTSEKPQSLLHAKCAKCHGVDKAQPGGELFFDADQQLDSVTAMRALGVINGENVPSSMEAVISSLTPEDIDQIERELRALWKREE